MPDPRVIKIRIEEAKNKLSHLDKERNFIINQMELLQKELIKIENEKSGKLDLFPQGSVNNQSSPEENVLLLSLLKEKNISYILPNV